MNLLFENIAHKNLYQWVGLAEQTIFIYQL